MLIYVKLQLTIEPRGGLGAPIPLRITMDTPKTEIPLPSGGIGSRTPRRYPSLRVLKSLTYNGADQYIQSASAPLDFEPRVENSTGIY